jgi:thiol:disulfide interchange protein DsbD
MMSKKSRLLLAFTALLLFSQSLSAQDSSLFKWNVTSKKLDDVSYQLIFSTQPVKDWKLYAPNQVKDLTTTEIQFQDPSISHDTKFGEGPGVKMVSNTLFGAANIYDTAAQWSMVVRFVDKDSVPSSLQGTLLYSYGKEPDYFYPSTPFSFIVKLKEGGAGAIRTRIPSIDMAHPQSNCGDAVTKDKSLLEIFLLGLVGGLLALLTPCVFPMIPLTVSFFTNKNVKKKAGIARAVLYGFFIFMIYILLTVPFHIAGKTDPEIFHNISTNVTLNLAFFVIFLVFAVSFFGYFDITLPSGLANKMDSRSGIGNIGGVFFMALTLAIVSFSCTGPILGTLLVGVAEKGAWPLTVGAAGFGLALGLPFALFSLFPKWLQSIPKSGGWMSDVKVVLGFVELALAIKFLANADNVKQWGVLKREVFIGLWVIIGLAIVLYLLGAYRFSHSSPVKRFSKIRIAFILLFAAATAYLVPGLTNTKWARLGLISGFPPPACYSVYASPVNCDKPMLDYEQALQLARQQNKPLLIDFTGWACVNCRRMEENVWTDAKVKQLMSQYVLVSLYVDEKRKLPASQQTVFRTKAGTDKSIVTVGDRWSTFQIENFGATSQPQYAIISPAEKALTNTKFYTPDAREYAAWLQCGLDAFKTSGGR